MLKFAVIGPQTQNTQDLCGAIKEKGHQFEVIDLRDIQFKFNDKIEIEYFDKNFLDFDVVIFRGYNKHISEAKILAQILVENGKVVIEQSLAGEYVRGKLQQAKIFVQNSINHPVTWQTSRNESWAKILEKAEFPIIAKPIFGRKGRGVEKLNSKEETLKFLSENSDDYLIQEYFPIISDYRVLVVGGEIIGAFKRVIKEGEYKSNIHGTYAEKIDVDEEMAKIALDATKALGYEIAGVDLMQHEGKYYIIEVNVSPQWEKFKAITKINPATKIIQYALDKLENLKRA